MRTIFINESVQTPNANCELNRAFNNEYIRCSSLNQCKLKLGIQINVHHLSEITKLPFKKHIVWQ